MNLLYLCHRIPYPPNKGEKARSFHQVQYLGARHRLHLGCFADDRADLEHVPLLRERCESLQVVFRSRGAARARGLSGLLGGGSLSVAAFRSGALRRFARGHLETGSIDAVVAFSAAMAQYARGACGAARLVDFVDVDSDKWLQYAPRHAWPASWIYRTEADRLARFEVEIAREWDHSLFVSRQEADLFRPRVPGRPVSWLPMGVDADAFRPPPEGATRAEAPTVIFTGTMDYFPNADAVCHFADEILPAVRSSIPGTRFLVVGRNPTPPVRRLARREGITVTGTVPDVRPFLAEAWVSVAPLRLARGVQSKVLEAMATGLPVVGTRSALEGLDAGAEDGARQADEPADFAGAVVELLRDSARRRALGARARAFVEREHRWDRHGAALEALLLELVSRRTKGAA